MKRILTLALVAAACASLAVTEFADARRLSGGRSFGTQRSTPHATTPAPSAAAPSTAPATPGAAPNPVMPAQPGAPSYARPGTASPATVAPGAAPRAGMSRWLAPVAGLAAGLGLAALLSHFGLSETFASFLLIALVVVGAVLVLRLAFGRRSAPREVIGYAGAAAPGATIPKGYETDAPRSERREPSIGVIAAPAPSEMERRYPEGFDPVPFLAQARSQFVRLQAAYDKGDRDALADVMTPEMFAEIARELDVRGPHVPSEVVEVDAEIVDVGTEGDRHWASVRFNGRMRDEGSAATQPFDEAWNLVKPVDGSSGWLLAGIRQMEAAA